MARKLPGLTAALLVLGLARFAWAQLPPQTVSASTATAIEPPPPPPSAYSAPPSPAAPASPSSPNTAAAAPYYPPPGGTAGVINGPPPCAPFEDRNGPLLRGDPLLDQSMYGMPGWFSAAEIDIVKPHVKYVLSDTVQGSTIVPPGMMFPSRLITDQVALPMATLDWTGAPRVELGYRLPEGCGEFLVTYRSLVSEGSGILADFDVAGAGLLRSRVDLEVVDLDYASREYSLGPNWDIKWITGVRFADIFVDSRADGLVLEQRSSDHFWGVGPHVGLDLRHHLGNTRLSLFGKLELAALLGQVHQSFEETIFNPASQVATAMAGATLDKWQTGMTIEVQGGLSWRPWACRPITLSAGYEFEEWWYIGTVNGNHATLSDQGFFLRAEWNY